MITHITYEVTFPTGRRLSANVSLNKGTTAVTGPNESGKSTLIEMIRFCLFGSAALRGVVDDYKTLKTSLNLVLKGEALVIERTVTNAKLFRGNEIIATGTRPVNEKIVALLGFGLDVFDVACVANQDEVLALGAMKPTERKRMVDQVIGLDRMDDLDKWASEQATLLNREITVLDKALVEPSQPVKPEGYELSAVLSVLVDSLRADKSKLDYLDGWLSIPRDEPVKPVRPTTRGAMGNLQEELRVIDETEASRKHIMSIPLVDPELSLAWNKYDAWQSRLRFERAHPKPELTFDQVQQYRKDHANHSQHEALVARRRSLENSPHVVCPTCNTGFSLQYHQLAEIDAELEKTPEGAFHNQAYLNDQEAYVLDWLNTATRDEAGRFATVEEAPKPTQPRPTTLAGYTAAQRHDALDALPQGLRARSEVVGEIAALERWLAASEGYEQSLEAYQMWKREYDEKRAAADALRVSVAPLAQYEQRLQAARSYETSITLYEAVLADYRTRVAALAEKREELAGWKETKSVLTDIRASVKTHLVPSLSKVASHLLAKMTGGQRSSIVVNENFDITVDGQRLETLSGSGKACANLALRIGLGQVLTNNVLSIFIGDEIDASMDQDRASNTQDSLKSLEAVISQIILVTHKIPSADTVVRLG